MILYKIKQNNNGVPTRIAFAFSEYLLLLLSRIIASICRIASSIKSPRYTSLLIRLGSQPNWY